MMSHVKRQFMDSEVLVSSRVIEKTVRRASPAVVIGQPESWWPYSMWL